MTRIYRYRGETFTSILAYCAFLFSCFGHVLAAWTEATLAARHRQWDLYLDALILKGAAWHSLDETYATTINFHWLLGSTSVAICYYESIRAQDELQSAPVTWQPVISILEYGCVGGHMVEVFSKMTRGIPIMYHEVDSNKYAIEVANEKYGHLGIQFSWQIYIQDLHNFEPCSFDVLYSSEIINYLNIISNLSTDSRMAVVEKLVRIARYWVILHNIVIYSTSQNIQPCDGSDSTNATSDDNDMKSSTVICEKELLMTAEEHGLELFLRVVLSYDDDSVSAKKSRGDDDDERYI